MRLVVHVNDVLFIASDNKPVVEVAKARLEMSIRRLRTGQACFVFEVSAGTM